MQVKKLQQYIEDFKVYLKKDRIFQEAAKWEAQANFQKYWDIDTPDFGSMYKQCLKNTQTQRLWKRESWFPKEMMLKLIAVDQEFVRRMFKDLFDESREIETRISRFKFGCDELLSDFKKQNKRSIENNHYHDNNEMILLYLSFRFPQEYTFYDYPTLKITMELLGSLDIPGPYDLTRFFKITKVLYTFLQKDESLKDLHLERLSKHRYTPVVSKLLVHDFCMFVVKA